MNGGFSMSNTFIATIKNSLNNTKLLNDLLNDRSFLNSMNFHINKTYNHYAIPELEIAEGNKDDYYSDLKTSFLIGTAKAVKNLNFEIVTEKAKTLTDMRSVIMAYISGHTKREMFYGDYGVLTYMKRQYPQCTEYYLRLLIQIHKKGILKHVADLSTKELVDIVGSSKTAEKLQKIFAKNILNSAPVNMIKYAETEKKADYSNVVERIKLAAAAGGFKPEEIIALNGWLETNEVKTESCDKALIKRFLKFAKEYAKKEKLA